MVNALSAPPPPSLLSLAHAGTATRVEVRARTIAVEPARRVRPPGAQRSQRRFLPPAPERDETARPRRAIAQGNDRVTADAVNRPSTLFLAQYAAQHLASGPIEQGARAGWLAYRAAAERGIVHYAFDTPIDIVV